MATATKTVIASTKANGAKSRTVTLPEMQEITCLFSEETPDGIVKFTRPMFIRRDLGENETTNGNRYIFIGWDDARSTFSAKCSGEVLRAYTKGQQLEGVVLPDGTTCLDVNAFSYTNKNGNETTGEKVDFDHDGERYRISITRFANGSGEMGGKVSEPTQRRQSAKVTNLPAVASRWA